LRPEGCSRWRTRQRREDGMIHRRELTMKEIGIGAIAWSRTKGRNALREILFFAIVITAFFTFVGCDSQQSSNNTAKSSEPKFASIPVITEERGYIGNMSDGILLVDGTTGTISVCAKSCVAIGQTEPGNPNFFALSSGRVGKAFVTNLITGKVTACVFSFEITSSGYDIKYRGEFKNGSCTVANGSTR